MAVWPSFSARGTLADWARIFTDTDTWRPAVEEICRRHALPPAREIVPGFPGSNAVFMVDRRWAVKIAWPFARTGFERECGLLEWLEPYRAQLFTPRLVARGRLQGDPDWPYCIMERVPGERLGDVWPSLTRAERLALAEQLGRWVQALHAVPLSPTFTRLDPSRAAWEGYIAERAACCAAELAARDGLPEHLLAQLPEYLAGAAPLYPADVAPVLLNGDVTEDHVLLCPGDRGWRICGYIDFDDALAGHAEWEFTTVHLAVLDRDAELLRAFLQAYGWDGWQRERFRRRMMAYCLLHPWFDFRPWMEQLGGAAALASLEALEAALWDGCTW